MKFNKKLLRQSLPAKFFLTFFKLFFPQCSKNQIDTTIWQFQLIYNFCRPSDVLKCNMDFLKSLNVK